MGRLLRLPPPAILALLYAGLILIGTVLLWLPVSVREAIGPGDAFFTATSAVTVTGLAVVDTGSAFTPFGQGVIAALIQFGGLGLMTFAVLLLRAFGLPIGLPQRMVLRDALNQTTLHDLAAVTRLIAAMALICEALGTLALAFVFVPDEGWGRGLWSALFHSISAFNNAGFSLYPDSLTRYVANPVVNLVIPALFILGGLGFIVVGELIRVRRWRGLSLHSKLMLTGTAALIFWSFVAFAALEWRNPGTLGALDGTGAKLWAAWFQAVTPRTAGFNSLDYAQMHDATTLMTMSLMVVGGGSTSTAGGIKVTTLIVLLVATVAFFRRSDTINIYGRSLGTAEAFKVLGLTAVSILTVLTGVFVMTMAHDGKFIDIVFEVTSAFGTVGLSRGLTGDLDGVGRTVVCTIMFMGRLGPLTFGFLLITRAPRRVRYPKGEVYLG